MSYPPRTLSFVLAATDHGSLITSRFDYHLRGEGDGFGVGYSLLRDAQYETQLGELVEQILRLRRRHFGDGVMVIDCGANIGVHTISWARATTGWGSVLAIEAQERLFYALAGNIAINNCFNARAIHAAAAATVGRLRIPTPDYLAPGSFGSLELRRSETTEYIGQTIDYDDPALVEVPMTTIDALGLARIDLLKIDVEGMELEVLQGAVDSIGRCQPIIIIEHLKTPKPELSAVLQSHGYRVHEMGLNFVAVHLDDPLQQYVVSGPAA